MKKTPSPAQLADILAKVRAFVSEPLQIIEFTDAEMGVGMDLGINVNTDFDFTAVLPLIAKPSIPAATTPCPGTRKMCIRMPNAITQAFKAEAKRRCIPYQTLINRVLKEQSQGW